MLASDQPTRCCPPERVEHVLYGLPVLRVPHVLHDLAHHLRRLALLLLFHLQAPPSTPDPSRPQHGLPPSHHEPADSYCTWLTMVAARFLPVNFLKSSPAAISTRIARESSSRSMQAGRLGDERALTRPGGLLLLLLEGEVILILFHRDVQQAVELLAGSSSLVKPAGCSQKTVALSVIRPQQVEEPHKGVMYLAESVGCVEPPPLRLGRTVPDEARDIVDDLEQVYSMYKSETRTQIRRTIQPLAGGNDDPAVGQQTHGEALRREILVAADQREGIFILDVLRCSGGEPGGRREGKEALTFALSKTLAP